MVVAFTIVIRPIEFRFKEENSWKSQSNCGTTVIDTANHGLLLICCLTVQSSQSKVNLEAGKDKELFYKKTRLAWAT